ncbi:undecaprenyldiphospho-muramoylpentapeptide beta-N-acetylglucosaminyltransferase [Corynebacterium striatum]|uniref:undecaprenyldiphospho-muramoylpentapeptide beta-N-acetylglucosaminyltransferase n=1 Tax=Corynebacterium striatum TaxID=43770 RepID=UPI0014195F83|nr:undecaprenyldiphospho-muramoylpentapeptide beta-N-acetylglucosaminyltransferase [Corynebacterium striatum]NHY11646.1 undecaprenyldiphospho-muramoylpentapeptide beta-N-acetylglucosaminyltransferase [Corynebacterium striatum]NHY36292.1 undecaprenyldiphospho-muramoylpentapeptide beta-N-acetylglucosaminyltransferase [Corynebacterium striatum]HAT1132497.1 undecaprenyldiphospho-muramoylpentapeptide beta-N-acetylglucosaminyltransferase [Corynebacterium striatum]HAT1139190.1 undecaprenyldiphospho-mu
MNSTPISVVIAGGGTAGHIEPALAVGEALRQRHGARLTALGTQKGLERDIVPGRGVDLRLITPVPVPRKVNAELFKLPFNLIKSVLQTRKVLKEVEADVVFGTGGYVAAPAYLAAKSMGMPFYVLETNALSGIANKLGVRIGGIGLNAHRNSGMPGEVVGIPVRPGLGEDPDGSAAAAARERWNLDPERPTIVVTGGSQGAVSINTAVAGALSQLTEKYQVLHAYGKKNAAPAEAEHYTALPYIDDMAGALAVADLMVCRSGAMTVAEVTAAGVPAIYIPLPIGNGEQALNSRELVAAGAAVQILDAELTPQRLVDEVQATLGDEQRYAAMRKAAATNAAGDVANTIADHIRDMIDEASRAAHTD